ncbi:MAG: CCA tRNA nucleotidyltransferase [Nitrososphaerota archaeon]|nr:CCA tRNA nucleotidyltransferase [Aigarchaeota archaeon]MDW8076150.1 CCA tRNA nucleotidyltransferase [Nitrososphaerota archaeon]
MQSIEEVMIEVLQKIKPSLVESEKLMRLANELLNTVKNVSSNYKGIVDVRLEGSVAKGTWIKGREEIDVFVQFLKDVNKDALERAILEIGSAVIGKFGGKIRIRYAEHPYVEGIFDSVRVNIVACYKVEPGTWLSAVDRTPYHTEYVKSKLTETLTDEVRLMKSFMLGCGVYGAEIKIGGFSGYLAELLTINYGSFSNAIKAASNWRPPVYIDIEKHYADKKEALEIFGRPCILVVDPVDKKRNVAAAVTDTKLSEFILASKLFFDSPSDKFFYIPERTGRRITMTDIRRMLRGRCILGLRLKVQQKPPDVLWGEIKHTLKGIYRALEHEGFKTLRCDAWSEGNECIMIFELQELNLPACYIHHGPPTYLDNALEFVKKHSDTQDTVAGPWVSGSRLYVLKSRDKTSVKDIIKMRLTKGDVSVSAGLVDAIKNAKIYKSGEEFARLASKNVSFRQFLFEFLEARPPFLAKRAQ